MQEQNSAGLPWISPNPGDLSKEVSVTVLLSETGCLHGTSCCTFQEMTFAARVDVRAHWHRWGEECWCQVWLDAFSLWYWVFAMLFLGCRGEFEICVSVRNYLEWASGWQALFFLGTVTSLKEVLPNQGRLVRAEVGKFKSWAEMWLHSGVFSPVENRHTCQLSQLWKQTC